MIEKIGSGKVRELYRVDDDRLFIVTTDRISAFDVILPTPIPDKGRVLNRLSLFWFDYTADLVKNHLLCAHLSDFPAQFRTPEFEGRSMLVKKVNILPFECIVRGYITGSGWSSYQKNGTVCGIDLPSGLIESEKLPEPIFTPSTKAAEGHDENISFDRMVDLAGVETASRLRATALSLYTKCADYALSRGLILADTKFEFGYDAQGDLVLADEVLTPDSSRFWSAADYAPGRGQRSFDKQFVRDWLKAQGKDGATPAPELPADVVSATRGKYIEAYERITGTRF